jgi:arsenite-transporting ATPase
LQYLEQYNELYEDFHLVKLPLLEEEVRGLDALQAFSQNLLKAYQPPPPRLLTDASEKAALEAQVASLTSRVKELEAQLQK